MTSYKVIGHKIELDRSMLKEYKWTERKIYFSTDVLGRLDIRKVLFIIELDKLDVFR